MRSTADEERRDPETARAVHAAREKMESLEKVTPFLLGGSDPNGAIEVEVAAPYGAGDLSIINGSYALVASGVGWVNASLPPGTYSVRHQLGDESAIEPIKVFAGGPGRIELPALRFASPIPLFGTRFFRDDSDLKSLAGVGGNFRLLLWAPAPETSDGDERNRARIEVELQRLRLEVFAVAGPAARRGIKLPAPIWTGSGSALLATTLEPGCYVLVQTDDTGRQRCLPIWVHRDLLTCVFLLSLEMDGSTVPLDLDHAGITFLLGDGKRGPNWIDSLYQLEAARKTITQGRQVQGWAGKSINAGESTKENPLLHLIDAILVFGSSSPSSREAPLEYGSSAAERFEGSFPDGMALRVAMTRLKRTDLTPLPEEFTFAGPPLLRRSWALLLRGPRGNAALGKLMDFPFIAEGSGAWFVWSEERVARDAAASARTPEVRDAEVLVRRSGMPPQGAGALSAILVAGVKLIGGLFARSSRPDLEAPAAAGGAAQDGAPPSPQGQLAAPTGPVVTFDNVVDLLVALTENDIIQKYLDSGRRYAASKGVAIDEAVLHRLVHSLTVLKNKTLVKALTAEVLVREALVSLGLPKEKVIQLVRTVLADLMSSLSDKDRASAQQVMAPVLDTVERWLEANLKR